MAISSQNLKTAAVSVPLDGTDAASPGELLSVDEIMLRIRHEVISRGGQLPVAADPAGAASMPKLASWQPSAPRVAVKQEYALHELLSFSDADFVENAYRAVLRRAPDAGGMTDYLSRLRNGQESKVGILAALRWSPEGEQAGVHVDGLLAPFLMQKWRRKRVIGPIVGWLHSLARLSSLSDRQVMLDAAYAREHHELGRVINLQAQQVEQVIAQIESARAQQALASSTALHAISTAMENVVAHARVLMGRVDGLQTRLDEVSGSLTGIEQMRAHSNTVAEQVGTLSSRLDGMSDIRGQLSELSMRLNEIGDVRAHSHAVAGHVGTLSVRLDELTGVQAHSHAVAAQVGGLSTRLDELSVLSGQMQTLVYRIDTVTARLDGQPDVVPVVRLISERLEALSTQLQAGSDVPAARDVRPGSAHGK